MMRKPWLVVLIVVVVVVGFLYKKYRVAPDLKFENLELTDLNGNAVKLQDYPGKKIFLNFFQTWCGPCINELPDLDNTAASLEGDNFIFLGISDEPLPLLNRLQARLNLHHVIILHSVKKLKQLNIYTYPTSYLLNSGGQVILSKTGEEDWSEPETINALRRKAR